MLPPDVFDADHIKPKAAGGTNEPSNIQMICSPCNRAKGKKSMAEFMATGLRWVGGPCLDEDRAKAAVAFYCGHKRIAERCTALLTGVLEPHTEAERASAGIVLAYIDNLQGAPIIE